MKKLFYIFALLIAFINIDVKAENRVDFIKDTSIKIDKQDYKGLNDNNYKTFKKINKGTSITLSSKTPFKNVYIIYHKDGLSKGTIKYGDNLIDIGEKSFLHEFVELPSETDTISINYDKSVILKEIFVFTNETPSWVQKWEDPCDDADLMLLSAHSDDEHIFFAGLIPSMLDAGKKVQVVYLTRHESTPIRFDELLNGLWVAGIKNYPVFGPVVDRLSKDLNSAIKKLSVNGMSIDKVIKFNVDMVRRFKPEIVVTHDENGEYGHGQHMLCAYSMEQAIPHFLEENYKSEYPPYSPYKVYIHSYEENTITMDYDIPLNSYNGKTAYRVSMEALSEHESQLYLQFKNWIKYDSAKDVKDWSPLYFGLYYSTVGYENEFNNMFYNIPEKKIYEDVKDEEIKEDADLTTNDEKKPSVKREFDSIIFVVVLILAVVDIILIIKILKNSSKR